MHAERRAPSPEVNARTSFKVQHSHIRTVLVVIACLCIFAVPPLFLY